VLPIRLSVEEFVAIMSADDLAAACAAIRDQIVAGRPIGPGRSCSRLVRGTCGDVR